MPENTGKYEIEPLRRTKKTEEMAPRIGQRASTEENGNGKNALQIVRTSAYGFRFLALGSTLLNASFRRFSSPRKNWPAFRSFRRRKKSTQAGLSAQSYWAGPGAPPARSSSGHFRSPPSS